MARTHPGDVRVARGMIGREVELGEVVRLLLDLGARVDRVAEPVEEVEQFVLDLAQHVPSPDPGAAPGERDVEAGDGIGALRDLFALLLRDLEGESLELVERLTPNLALGYRSA
jgi:hypothetical protein